MFRRSSSILAIKSTSVLYTVGFRRCIPLHSTTKSGSLHGDVVDGIRNHALLRGLRAAAERNADAQLDPGDRRCWDGNPGGLSDQRHPAGNRGGASRGVFRVGEFDREDHGYDREILNGDYTEKAAGLGRMPGGYGRGTRDSSHWNQDGHLYGESIGVLQEGTSGYGSVQAAIGNDKRVLGGEVQQTSRVSGHQVGYQQRQNGYHPSDRLEFQQSAVGHSGGFGQNENVNHRPYPREGFQQNPHAFQKSVEYQQRPNGFHAEKPIEFSPDGYSGRLHTNQAVDNKASSRGDVRQVRETIHNPVEFHQRPNGSYTGKPNEFQPMPGGYSAAINVTGNLRDDLQQTPQVSYNPVEYQRRTNGYVEKPSEFHNSSSEYYGESGTQPSISLMSGGTESDKPLVENVENGGYKGTLDELDALCKERKLDEAVKVLDLLEKQGTAVDLPRYFQLFQLCGDTKSLEEARTIHGHLFRVMGKVEINVCNRMLEMYSRCGSMEDACELFETMPRRNLTSWDTMIMGFANNELGEDAIDLFTQFKQKGLSPDSHIFVTVFHACGVLGAVDEGMLHFESMSKEYGIVPAMEHYVGIVCMLGEAGYLEEALEFIEKMPYEPSVCAWETLMNHCRVHGNVDLGDRCAEIVESIDSSRLTHESKAGLVPVKASDMVKKEKKKSNLLEVRSKMHEYRAGDRSHPERDRIYAQIHSMAPQMKEAGYVPETRFVLHDVDQESKEEALLYHSEKLATAFSLISTTARSQIRIIKNLRICVDCHNALKIVSKLSGRRFIIRDVKRFHHMEDGVCTCNDYW